MTDSKAAGDGPAEPEPEHERELERLRTEYARRRSDPDAGFYDLDRPANLFIRHGQERALLRALGWSGALPLRGRRILEVGCGSGQWLWSFLELGASERDLCAIDLDAAAVEAARGRAPHADLRVGDASTLPWPDATFDVVFQSTVFTSILHPPMRAALAAEMVRVCRPGGAILWYDFSFDNPRNAAVRGIAAAEVRALFPGLPSRFWRVTLAPPITRRLAAWSWTLASLLEAGRVLNTHLMAALRRPGGG